MDWKGRGSGLLTDDCGVNGDNDRSDEKVDRRDSLAYPLYRVLNTNGDIGGCICCVIEKRRETPLSTSTSSKSQTK
jgi:hypothetical protein